MADNIDTLTDASFADAISGDAPVLVDFWAEWCQPCKLIAPVLDELAQEQSALRIAKLNIDDNPMTPPSHGVMSIPTLIVFQGGEERKRIIGAKPKAAMLAELAEFLT